MKFSRNFYDFSKHSAGSNYGLLKHMGFSLQLFSFVPKNSAVLPFAIL